MVEKILKIFKKSDINNRYLRYLLKKLFNIIFFIKSNRIVLLQESYSGSNTYALNFFFSKNFKSKFEIIFLHASQNIFLKYYYLSSSKIIISTHASYKFKKKQISFQLWHGAFIKKALVMTNSNNFNYKDSWYKIDYILSYSQTYSTLMNACMLSNGNKYIVTGAPRNDFLFFNKENNLINNNFAKKIIVTTTMSEKNNFKYDIFTNPLLDKFLAENNFAIYIKPHPADELKFNKKVLSDLKNIFILTDEALSCEKIDLYQVLNQFDVLITDYSSIFIDFLLLNRPILFLKDEDFQRGFLIEDLDSFMPGPIFTDLSQLKKYLSEIEGLNEEFKIKKDFIKKQFHRYNDNLSSARVEKFIESLM
jgi:CDP-glycerol glycerophosphotransferase (TagB/SpsB family)